MGLAFQGWTWKWLRSYSWSRIQQYKKLWAPLFTDNSRAVQVYQESSGCNSKLLVMTYKVLHGPRPGCWGNCLFPVISAFPIKLGSYHLSTNTWQDQGDICLLYCLPVLQNSILQEINMAPTLSAFQKTLPPGSGLRGFVSWVLCIRWSYLRHGGGGCFYF